MAAKLRPPGDVTGYQHPKCYACGDSNCSTKISKEHYFSATLLRQIELNNTAKVAGLKWLKPETFRIVPLGGLVSHILCERHNHSLSPLDDAIGRFSEAIGEYDRKLCPSTLNSAVEHQSFSGIDIERWMLKCVIGLVASKNFNSRLKNECINLLYGRTKWPKHWRLFFQSLPMQPIYHSSSFMVETLVDPAKNLVLAVKFVIRGIPFLLCLGRPDEPGSIGIWRPSAIVFKSDACEKTLSLNWDSNKHGEAVILNRRGTYDGLPPNWKEWERKG